MVILEHAVVEAYCGLTINKFGYWFFTTNLLCCQHGR